MSFIHLLLPGHFLLLQTSSDEYVNWPRTQKIIDYKTSLEEGGYSGHDLTYKAVVLLDDSYVLHFSWQCHFVLSIDVILGENEFSL